MSFYLSKRIDHQRTPKALPIPLGIGSALLCLLAMQPTQSNTGQLDAGIPWEKCTGYSNEPIQAPALTPGENATIYINADSAEAFGEGHGQLELRGKVEMSQGSQTLSADQASLNRTSGEIQATGNVFINRGDLRLQTQKANYNLNNKTGSTDAAEYRLGNIPARGTAQQSELLDANRSQFKKVNYTTCQPGNNAWHLAAGELEIDHEEGVGIAYHSTLSVGDVPVAYLPVLTFPLDDRRRSGVLAPTAGHSDTNGYDLTIPYYFNLAPNLDLTISPRLMSERGTMLGGEFRFLTNTAEGKIKADYLPKDNVSDLHDERGSIALKMTSRFTPNISGLLDIQHVSDNEYLDDMGGELAVSSATLLKRLAEIRYQDENWDIAGRAQHYQSLNNSKPYSVLPQLTAKATFPGTDSPLTYHLSSEITHFVKNSRNEVEGTRLNIHPAVSYPVEADFYHIRPKLGAQYTAYDLDNQASGYDNSPDRLLPIFSLDGGLYFERDTQLFNTALVQTLEPRVFYLYIPNESQDDLPRFDVSKRSLSNISSLFGENRFNSPDRLGDANQLTMAVTTRFNDADTGREYLNASLGQILYFRDREVTLSNTAETDGTSAIIGELNAEFDTGWHGRSGIQWNPHDNEVKEALAQLSYRPDNDRILNLAYRLHRDVATHVELASIWPITDQVKAIGRWNYSLTEDNTPEAFGGLEYGECCWRVRALTRYYDNDNDDEGLEFFLQFELKGLGKLGDNIDHLLAEGINGYQ